MKELENTGTTPGVNANRFFCGISEELRELSRKIQGIKK
jgi:hypothetical protein